MSSNMDRYLHRIEKLNERHHLLLKRHPDLWPSIQQKLRIEWTYNSNAIEGNTLTLGETAFFLREGLTSEGKPLKDYLEVKNHVEAIDGLQEIVAHKRPITEGLIKELHAVLMKDMEFTYARGGDGLFIKKALHPGQYKKQPNHVLTLSGTIHHYTDPLHVTDEMEKLIYWLHNIKMHTIKKAALFHYKFVSIHPFDDGNGRLARILMNLILMQDGYPPCIIQNLRRREYLESLELADITKKTDLLVFFVVEEVIKTMGTIVDTLEGKKEAEIISTSKKFNQTERENLIIKFLSQGEKNIGQLTQILPSIPRPTLKKDLARLVKHKKIQKKGVKKGVIYFLK